MSDPKTRALTELIEVVRRLRAPDGCPWDRAQTFASLRPFVIEEAFEVVDALDRESATDLCEELGDLLMQVVLLSSMAAERGWFELSDVAQGIAEKLVRRHPHVFGDAKVGDAAEVVERWEAIKAKEKAGRGALEGIPVAMPALSRAVRVGEKAGRVGYDWPDVAGVRDKLDEELAELDAAEDHAARERELGDVLFTLASWARHRAIDPEAALRGALDRFTARFGEVERLAREEGVALAELDEAELDRRWQTAKRALDR